MAERTLPAAPDAEVAVLGGVVLDGAAAADVVGELRADDFAGERHRTLWRAVEAVVRSGDTVDPVTLGERLRESGELERAGGSSYLATLVDAVPTAANIRYHAGLIRDRAVRRRLYGAAQQVADDAVNGETDDLAELLDRAERRVFGVAEGIVTDGAAPMRDLLWDTMAFIESAGADTLPTGIGPLDAKVGGLRPGNLVLLAARPSLGKTALALQIATNVAVDEGKPVGLFSVEMTKTENVARILAMEAMVDLHAMFTGRVGETNPAAFEHLTKATARLQDAPLWIDDTATRVLEVRGRARRLRAQHPDLALIVVDHIHDMTDDSAEDRRQEVGKIGRGLKHLAKELGVPVLALSQLSRKPEDRADKKPVLSDLREAGDLEQLADAVWMLHRPEFYFGPSDPDGNPIKGLAELLITKHRNGPTGTVRLDFTAHCARFEDPDAETTYAR